MKIKFSEEEIEEIKTIASDKEIVNDDDMEKLILLKRQFISGDLVALAKLFLICYNTFFMEMCIFNEYSSKVGKYLDFFKEDSIFIMERLNEYNDGKEICSNYNYLNIVNLINKRREDYLGIVNLFFTIFSEQ